MEATEHRRAIVEAVTVIARNPVVRWVVGGMLAALCSVALFAVQRELRSLNQGVAGQSETIKAQNEAIKAQSAAIGKVEQKIGDISEKLARVEERYANHASRIDDIVKQVDEVRRRLDQMVVERDMRLQQWHGAMARDAEDKAENKAIRAMLRRLVDGAKRGPGT
jgi:septal ring factor EnvC (AmiA/AmiB activator)